MKIEQFVMAYEAEQDRLRALLPEGFSSLRPVLRINAEIQDENRVYLEFNTAVQSGKMRGWLNIACWDSEKDELSFEREGRDVTFTAPFLKITYRPVDIQGSCPAEKDNDGCFFLGRTPELRPPEEILENKEFCDCQFAWSFSEGDACGVSTGKTVPLFASEPKNVYQKQELSTAGAAAIPCKQVAGAYRVSFQR